MFFDGFPGMDGPGGGFPGMGRSSKPADTTKFYKLLEVDKSASAADIRKAYRKLALTHHPDRGGDAEKFKEIRRAYEVLSDSDKRADYDNGKYDDDDDEWASTTTASTCKKRPKTKDVVQPMKFTLEQLYQGTTKKMAITRQVVDKKKGVKECRACDGQGTKVEVIRMGPMIQQVQSPCGACGGQGRTFTTKQEREVLEVMVQKGAVDGHKIRFREMADERPGADTGDVVFVCKQQEHAVFKRKGADLFMEKKISLVEALCGFSLDVQHLDGRKLLVKSAPGEIVKPMSAGFDPLADADSKTEWEVMEDCDCPSIDNVAEADTTDVGTLKKACETQLKRQGIDVGCFVVDGQRAYFKQCTRGEALAAKKTRKGATMYVLSDPDAKKSLRMVKAVKGEGMPTFRSPFVYGNLFIIFTIEFPESLTPDAQNSIRSLLPAPLNRPEFSEDDEGVEVPMVTDIDPVASFEANKINMAGGSEAYDDEDEDERPGRGPGVQQCQQQ